MLARRLVISTLALGFLAGVPTAADAQTKMIMSGRIKQYCCDSPKVNLGGAPNSGWPDGYNWAAYYGVTPMNPLAAPGGMMKIYPRQVTTVGGQPKNIHVNKGLFGGYTTFFIPDHPALDLKTLAGTFSNYNAEGTLAAGGSPGTFSFCPASMGPAPGACASAGGATSPLNGRIYRKAMDKVSKFGGTMALIGFGSKTKVKRYAGVGVPTYTLAYIVIPQEGNGAAPPGHLNSVTNKSYTNTKFAPTTAKNGPFYGMLSLRGAGPWGTGYQLQSLTMFANPPTQTVGITGYDKRTAMGFGNVQLVSGIIFNGKGKAPGANMRSATMTLQLPEPGTAQGVAVAALALALIGWTRARSRS